MKRLNILLPILLLQACSLKPDFNSSPTVDEYLIQKPHVLKQEKKHPQTLKIITPIAPSYMFSKKIIYISKDGSYGSYAYSFWGENLVKQLQFLLTFSLSESFKNVIIAPSMAKYDLMLETRVQSFELDEKKSQVNLILEAFLLNKDKNIVKSKSFNISSKLKSINPSSVVKAHSEIIQKLHKQISHWLIDIN